MPSFLQKKMSWNNNHNLLKIFIKIKSIKKLKLLKLKKLNKLEIWLNLNVKTTN